MNWTSHSAFPGSANGHAWPGSGGDNGSGGAPPLVRAGQSHADASQPNYARELSADSNEDGLPSSVGPVRDNKNVAQPPVKSACTFCRSRKSRCNGKSPCAACIARGREDDCCFTISRRGGKPKPKADRLGPLESHMEQLFSLADMTTAVRVPGEVPGLRQYQNLTPEDSGWTGPDLSLYPGLTYGDMSTALHTQMPHAGPGSVGSSGNNGAPNWNAGRSAPPALTGLNDYAPASPPGGTQTLLAEYYRYLYCFLPVFLAPAHVGPVPAAMSPSSPFLLAIQAVIPFLREEPLQDGMHPSQLNFGSAKHERVRDTTARFERMASEAIDEALERIESSSEDTGTSEAITLEVIQALSVLVIYEYGSGRALKARLKADQALGLAMSKGYHQATSPTNAAMQTPSSFTTPRESAGMGSQHPYSRAAVAHVREMKKRVWWTVWSLVMWCAYNTARAPTIRADDPRVRVEMPVCKDDTAWGSNVRSLQALLLVQDRVLALSHLEDGDEPLSTLNSTTSPASSVSAPSPHNAGHNASGSPHSSGSTPVIPSSFSSLPPMASRRDILRSMEDIDAALQEQIAAIEAPGANLGGAIGPHSRADGRLNASADDVEENLAAYLRISATVQLYTSSLTLHLGQAFQGASLFERKLCFLSSVNESAGSQAACQVPMPDAFMDEAGNGLDGAWMSQQQQQQALAPAPVQDLYARGPFLPRLSLERCVHASKRLLEIAHHASTKRDLSPNPFNGCSLVLISFVCLMQALAISGGGIADDETFDANPNSTHARELLLSAQGATALSSGNAQPYGAETSGKGNSSQQGWPYQTPTGPHADNLRLQRLERIWQRVKEAHDTLARLADVWRIAAPMVTEISSCLAASRALLAAPSSNGHMGGASDFTPRPQPDMQQQQQQQQQRIQPQQPQQGFHNQQLHAGQDLRAQHEQLPSGMISPGGIWPSVLHTSF